MAYLLVQSDARRIPLADASVHCVVTSPPYWALRDYSTAGQIGLESTPDAYIAEMVRVFAEVRRVLRDDGTLWLNMGDTYAGSWGNQGRKPARGTQRPINRPMIQVVDDARYPSRLSGTGTIPPDSELKPKDLCGMPWRLALALHADGWWLRSEIIWAKPNPMPESVTDRPTKSHEQVFLFAKSQRYYYDAGAVRLPLVSDGTGRFSNKRNCQYATHNGPNGQPLSSMIDAKVNPMGRNMPSVWSIPTEAYTGSHFATFPRKLVEPCIRAGTSEHGVCPQCGTPWQRLVDRHVHITGHTVKAHIAGGDLTAGHGWQGVPYADVTRRTIGWRPACPHPGHPIPAVVLDPFAGSGTVLVVAEALGRHAIGCDLSRPYLDMARRRIDRPHAKPIRPECTEHHPLFDREPPPALPGD